jgi:hypothetical protein
MRLVFVILLASVLSSTVLAQDSSSRAQAKAQPPKKCSLAGRVLKAGTDEPLKKAQVTLQKADSQEAPVTVVTDAGGQFSIENVDPGRYFLSVSRSGFVDQQYGQRSAHSLGAVLTLASGQNMQDLVFRLLPAAVIAGRVVDEDGEAVMGAHVQALLTRMVRGQRVLYGGREAVTNDLGEYRIFGLGPGRYVVSAFNSMMLSASAPRKNPESRVAPPDQGYVPTYYPGSIDPAQASPVEVKAGDVVAGVDFILVPTRVFRVRGRIINAVDSEPLSHIGVWLTPRRGGSGNIYMAGDRVSIDSRAGTFEFRNVPTGAYELNADWENDSKRCESHQPVDVANVDVDGLSIVFAPGVDLAGKIITEGNPGGSLSDVSIRLSGANDSTPIFASAVVKSDGAFMISNLSEGAYRLNLWNTPRDSYLKSARLGGEDVLNNSLTISRGGVSSLLEIVISFAAGQVQGSVLTGESLPSNDATVVLMPDSPKRDQFRLYRLATTDQLGRFFLRGIAPGDYKLFAWEDVEVNAWQDPDFLKPFEEKGRSVHIEENGRQTVELTSIAAKKPDGNP